jgi:hypothetical protein
MKYLYLSFLLLFTKGLSAQLPNHNWLRTVGSANAEACYSIATDPEGNVYAAGTLYGNADVDPGPSNVTLNWLEGHMYIIKYDASAQVIWAKNFGSEGALLGVAIDPDGNIILTGVYNATGDFDPGSGEVTFTSGGDDNCFISKLTSNGDLIWTKSIGSPINDDVAEPVEFYTNGNMRVLLSFQGTLDADPGVGESLLVSQGSSDIALVQLDANGNFIDAVTFGGPGIQNNAMMDVDAQGNTIVSGFFENTVTPSSGNQSLTSVGPADLYIAKLSPTNELLWLKQITGDQAIIYPKVAVDQEDNIYISATFRQNVDLDPSEATDTHTSSGMYDFFVLKLDSDGNRIWANHFGGVFNEFSYDSDLDDEGNFYTVGTFKEEADFDPSANVFLLTDETPSGMDEAYLLKLNPDGTLAYAGNTNANLPIRLRTVEVREPDNVWIAGSFSGYCDFSLDIAGENQTSVGDFDSFVAKYSTSTVQVESITEELISHVYPNPCHGQAFLKSSASGQNPIELHMINALGEVVYSAKITQSMYTLDMSHLASGAYFLRTVQGNLRQSRVVVKE